MPETTITLICELCDAEYTCMTAAIHEDNGLCYDCDQAQEEERRIA